MIVFDETASPEENVEAMKEEMGAVTSISITYAVRGTKIDGIKIAEGQILGLVNGKIASVANSDVEVIENLVDRMSDASFVTVFYGEKISEDAAEVVLSIIKSKLPADTEVTLIRGGQPIYDYIISVE